MTLSGARKDTIRGGRGEGGKGKGGERERERARGGEPFESSLYRLDKITYFAFHCFWKLNNQGDETIT